MNLQPHVKYCPNSASKRTKISQRSALGTVGLAVLYKAPMLPGRLRMAKPTSQSQSEENPSVVGAQAYYR